MKSEFEPEMLVVVSSRLNGESIGRVKRITKRFVELKSGSQWRLDGSPYPKQEWPDGHITPLKDMPEGTYARIKSARWAKKLASWKWNEVPMEQLESVLAILEGKAAPVFCTAPDGTPCEVCVVCGTLVFPRQLPHCEGCPDPEDAEDLYLDFNFSRKGDPETDHG
jgi:hypothetical protein